MDAALEQADLAATAGETPVGAVVADAAGNLLARARNRPVETHDPAAHAEILALRAAGKAAGSYRLAGCVLVVTLEPCAMCAAALVHARVDGVVFGAADAKAGAVISCDDLLERPFFNHRVWHMGGIRSDECAARIRNFFQERRRPACGSN